MSSSTPVATSEVMFQPVQVGRYELAHRIVMAPLTRSRARQPGNIPSSLNACYYTQRASAALIISEATQVSQQGQGYAWTPGECPCRVKSSERLRPNAFTRIRTHPGAGRGTGSCSILSTSGAPGSRMTAAFMVLMVTSLSCLCVVPF